MRRKWLRGAAWVTLLLFYSPLGDLGAQEPVAVEALPPQSLPELPRKILPPRACFTCPGPTACPPRLRTHSGFLYYNTYAIDDDPFNEFGDCPGGDCGYGGAALSLWWIGLHDPRIVNLGHRHQSVPAGPIGPTAVRFARDGAGTR